MSDRPERAVDPRRTTAWSIWSTGEKDLPVNLLLSGQTKTVPKPNQPKQYKYEFTMCPGIYKMSNSSLPAAFETQSQIKLQTGQLVAAPIHNRRKESWHQRCLLCIMLDSL